MTIIELKEKFEEKNKLARLLMNQTATLHREIGDLRAQIHQLELETFSEYLQIGENIELDKFYSFKGVCSDIKGSSSFSPGEGFKVLKKNKKSIVIEVTKKIKRIWDDKTKTSVFDSEYNPAWKIRVELESFFHFYLSNKKMKSAFESYIKRKQALDSLLDE